jgi:fructokinase
VLSALAFLGWDAMPVTRLGDDAAGDAVVADLAHHGVDTRGVRREAEYGSARIAQTVRMLPSGRPAHRFWFACPACGHEFPRFRPPAARDAEEALTAVPAPQVFFFDRTSAAILELAEAYRDAGALVYFEPSKVGTVSEFRRAVTASHIVKYSAERMRRALEAMGGLRAIPGVRRPAVEIETDGARGLRYRLALTGKRATVWRRQQPWVVDGVRDAAGAGDWCSAGVIARLMNGAGSIDERLSEEAVHDALRWGQALGALNCLFVGPRYASYVLPRADLLAAAERIEAGARTIEMPPAVAWSAARDVCQPGETYPGSGTRAVSRKRAPEAQTCPTCLRPVD